MTITLELPPEIEAGLAFPAALEMNAEDRERGLDELFDDSGAPACIAEAAFHRENWYR